MFSKKCATLSMLLILLAILSAGGYVTALNFSGLCLGSGVPNGIFRYEFIVGVEGDARVRITYSSGLKRGSSWLLVPRFIGWVNRTIHGRLVNWTVEEAEKYVGLRHYFYRALVFSFISDEAGFEIIIEYDFPLAALFVESNSPYGVFYSPQIGFDGNNLFEALIVFPRRFRANVDEALAIGRNGLYRADKSSNFTHIYFKNIPLGENLIRIQVGFTLTQIWANSVTLRNGIFEFTTVARYRDYAKRILDLYNATYGTLVNIFNVTLEYVRARFFVPDFNTLMSIGGYVPFSGGRLGDIYINLVFTRYVEGYLEVIALHELIHHFIWRAGISPEKLLWFHEGIAQYISLKIAEKMSYEGVRLISEEISGAINRLNLLSGGNLRFLRDWTPYHMPRESWILYVSAYIIISELAREYGGIEYYSKFFRMIKGAKIENNAMLCYYLSLAANRSIFDKINSWGFDLPDIYRYWPLITEVREAIEGISPVNPFLQPIRWMAETLYWAVVSGEASQSSTEPMLLTALFLARNVKGISLTIYTCILLFAIILILKFVGRR